MRLAEALETTCIHRVAGVMSDRPASMTASSLLSRSTRDAQD
jgi:hypothetical protein